MDVYRKLSLGTLVILAAWLVGCSEDTTRPDPPPPPPSISIDPYNASTTNLTRRIPDDEVYDILVDSQNRTWFATNKGVGLSEGSQAIKHFDDFNGIPNRQCRALAELNGRVFVGTWGGPSGGGGIGIYDGTDVWDQLTVADGLVSGRINSLAADDTSLWVGTVDGVSQYIDRGEIPMSERWIDHSDRLGSTRVVSKVLVHNDAVRGPEIWFGTQGDGVISLRLPAMRSVWGFKDVLAPRLDVFAVGDGGAIMHHDGSRWTSMDSQTGATLRGVWAADSITVHAVGDGGTAQVYNGERWRSRNSRTTQNLNAVWGSDEDNVFAVGDNGTIIRYNGSFWIVLDTPTRENLNGIWGVSETEVYAVGDNGTVIKYNGNSWRHVDIAGSPTERLNTIWGVSSGTIFAAGDNGRVIVNTTSQPLNGGRDNWTPLPSSPPQNLNAVWGSATNDVYAVGENGMIFRFDGANWTPQATGASANLTFNGVWGASANIIYAVGGRSTYSDGTDRFYFSDGGSWSKMSGTDVFLNAVRFREETTDIPGSDVTDITRDPNVDLFWMTFATRGVASVDVNGGVWTHFTRADGLNSDVAHSIDIDRQGTMWVGTQAGLTKRDAQGNILNYIAASGLPDARVRTVYVDTADRVWLSFIENGAGQVK